MKTLTTKNIQVKQMFSSIAHRYDFLNHLLSMGWDKYWRRIAVDQIEIISGEKYLDAAAGTGDMAIEVAKRSSGDITVFASDFSQNMLSLGTKKVKNLQLDKAIKFQLADSENLPFKNNSFHSAVCAFGVRNFSNQLKGIGEMKRVSKENGRVVILEFYNPTNPLFRLFYYFYFKKVLPLIGGLVSKKFSAYRYLPDSVINFYSREELKEIMENAGLKKVKYFDLSFGIVTVHIGYK